MMNGIQIFLVSLVAVSIVAAVVFVVVVLRRRRQRKVSPPIFRQTSDGRGMERVDRRQVIDDLIRELDRRETVLFPAPPAETAANLAAERRAAIAAAFREHGITLPIEESSFRTLPFEFMETPPEMERVQPRFFDERIGLARSSQMARLIWQLQEDHFLLGERVLDIVTRVHRVSKSTNLLVRLVPPSRRNAREKQFGWRAVVETDDPELFQDVLIGAANWLGIGVSFAPPREVTALGRCSNGEGLEGVVGGVLSSSRNEFAVTCAHVLSDVCGSVVHRGFPVIDSEHPDAVLLIPNTPCFRVGHERIPCSCASDAMLQAMIESRELVTKRNLDVPSTKGVLRCYVTGFRMNGAFHRFPHLEVIPDQTQIVGPLAYPPFPTPFSRRGHSGAWVFREVETNDWIGMVVGGDGQSSFVAQSQPLVNFFSLLTEEPGQQSKLQPFRFH